MSFAETRSAEEKQIFAVQGKVLCIFSASIKNFFRSLFWYYGIFHRLLAVIIERKIIKGTSVKRSKTGHFFSHNIFKKLAVARAHSAVYITSVLASLTHKLRFHSVFVIAVSLQQSAPLINESVAFRPEFGYLFIGIFLIKKQF